MQEPRIVLVLGAGASNPYGFWLGEALKSKVAMRTREMQNGPVSTAYNPVELDRFRSAIWRNRLRTIDEFLEEHPRFRQIGARLVAEEIASCESEDKLFQPQDWYTALFDELRLREEGPELSRLAIVTFNYERSLEYFIDDNILHNCPEGRQDYAHSMWNKVKIVHAHGSIGEYPEIGYGRALEAVHSGRTAKNLMLLTDKADESPAFMEAQQLVAKANRIVFVGFGYHKRTLDFLFPNASFKGKEIYGTCFNMSQNRISAVMSYFQDEMQFAESTLNAKSFMEALSNGPADRALFSGLDAMRKAKTGINAPQATTARSFPPAASQSPGVRIVERGG
jgi:hypothetical protein